MNGTFTGYPGNPMLINRKPGGYVIQERGHGDLVEDEEGNWLFSEGAGRIYQCFDRVICPDAVCAG